MLPGFPRLAVPAVLLLVGAAACTSASESDAIACEIRPTTYPPDTAFPPIERPDPKQPPNCSPTCGVEHQDGAFPVAGVPMGACDFVDGYVCTMPARGPCPSAEQTNAAIDEVRCKCEGGQWSCGVAVAGTGGGCTP